MFFSSNECFNTLKNPVECINCNTNYCKEHIKDFQFCPNCKKGPFNYKKNAGLKKLLENHENEIIKKDKETIECKYCSFEGNPGHFCYHFAEQYKKLLIDIFGVNILFFFKYISYKNIIKRKKRLIKAIIIIS